MLQDILNGYLELYPDEVDDLAILSKQIADADDLQNRKTLPGHITGAAIVLSPDKKRILMIHHAFLQRWLQPGGHWEPGESDPLVAAQREAVEETAVEIAEDLPIDVAHTLVPIDLESHHIPANERKNEPEHYHHDFRYVFVAKSEQLSPQAAEVTQAGWFAFDAPECASIRRVIAKMQAAGIIQA